MNGPVSLILNDLCRPNDDGVERNVKWEQHRTVEKFACSGNK